MTEDVPLYQRDPTPGGRTWPKATPPSPHALHAQKTGETQYLQDSKLRRELPDRNDQARAGSYQLQ